jgi:diaminopimelate epimerase
MGRVTFDGARIPVAGGAREVLNEKLTVGGREFTFSAASIGNPHCVLPLPEISEALARQYGPLIETEPRFPNRTNVQFLEVLDRKNIRIEIWERGAGYTLASGSSSSAAAAVAHRLGLVDRDVTVHMPGGELRIAIGEGFQIDMTGPVTKVGEGTIDPEAFQEKIEGIG